MKNIKIYIIFALVAVLASSCMDDLSSIAEFRYPELVVLEGPPESAMFDQEFTFEPQFSTIVDEDTSFVEESLYDDYTYEWRLLMEAGYYDTVTTVIGTERILSINLDMVPPASRAYFFILNVTHKEAVYTQMFNWEVEVLSRFGQGLLVAHTEDGGVSSDMNLLMTKAYNASFEETDEDIIYRNIVAEVNGQKLDGLVSQISNCNSTNNKYLAALVKGKSIVGVNPVTFEMLDTKNEDLFYFEPTEFKPTSIENYYGSYSMINNNGVLHAQTSSAGSKYAFVDEATYPYNIENVKVYSRWNSMYRFSGPYIGIDKKNNQFVFVATTGAVKELTAPQEGDDWAFNPRDIPEDLELVAGGKRGYYTALALTKSTTTNKYSIYRFLTNSSREISADFLFDLSGCPNMERATAFAFSETSDEFYYAVDNELYVVILNVEAPGATVVYTLPAGENISHLEMHLKIYGMTTWSETENSEGEMVPVWTSSPNKVISVASYNGSEGFVRTLPIQYVGAGGIADEKYVHTYDGFGKITDIELRY